MRPKGKLFVLLVLLTAIGLVTASGAFTTVSAERTADVSVANDTDALLGLEPNQTSNNGGQYAQFNNDQMEITLTEANLNADTEVDFVFNITNNGAETVYIWITKTGANSQYVDFYDGTVSSGTNITTDTNAQTLNSGDQMSVSIQIDTQGATLSANDVLLTDVTIHADKENPSP